MNAHVPGSRGTSTPPSATEHADGLDFFRSYQRADSGYDELLGSAGELRSHWRTFCRSLDDLGHEEFARRWQQVQRLVHENGIAYSASGDPRDTPRPWVLDPLPLVISCGEWERISAAIRQRMRLLNLILADIYGPQNLVKQGLLPAKIVYGHPGFHRPYHGTRPPDSRYLHGYAADLARAADGNWWVLADCSEAPSGSGFALENRIVTSRMLPDAFRTCRVERLAPYFMALQETLYRLAPQHHHNPRVALLSQGAQSPNYFEDAYLARYLGYTLIEGEDLTVRNHRMMLKTLGGLLPVDVILRRPNSEDCDPLELSGTSMLGTAGMLESYRRGNVAIANAPGSGLVESPVMMAFLPRLCQSLLGEHPKLPGVATWWCGRPDWLAHVLENLDQLVICPAFRQREHGRGSGKRLANLPCDVLKEVIKANPAAYVAQEKVLRSTMPVWVDRPAGPGSEAAAGTPSWQSSYIAMRAFAVAADQDCAVLPGGLARVSRSVGPPFLSLLAGEGSKDVWVLSDKPVRPITLLEKHGQPLELRRGGAELPSRVADHVYWLGRHIERADAAARLLRTVGLRITDETFSPTLVELLVLLRVLAEQGQIEPGYVVEGIKDQLPKIERGLPAFVFDETQTTSLRFMISQLFRAASVVRDRISNDCWRIVHRLNEDFQLPDVGDVNLSDLLSLIDAVIIDMSAFSGMAMESMTRTHTWRFLDLGRRLERALQTIRLVKQALGDPSQVQAPVMEAVLEVADSLMTYRSRYLANLQLGPLLDLLLTDETNPRSVAFQLVSIDEHVSALPRDRQRPVHSSEQQLAVAALQAVRMLDVEALAGSQESGDRDRLLRVLKGLETRLPALSNAISHRYLIHAGPAHQLAEIRPEEARLEGRGP